MLQSKFMKGYSRSQSLAYEGSEFILIYSLLLCVCVGGATILPGYVQ
jgi:hypothetical protein